MSPATRHPPEGGLRTDLEPLVSRFPDLGSPISAAWQSGTVGTSRLPPTIYWIDAVVTLEPATATTLRAAPDLAPTDPPQVPADLETFIPPGAWTTSPSLSTSFSNGGWACQVYLAAGTDVAVLLVKGRPETAPTLG
nr:hypothetical protein [Micromonospora sp. DSM 115978]